MVNVSRRRLRDVSILSVAVLLIQTILSSYVYPAFGQTTQQLFSVSPTTGIGGTNIGSMILSTLSGAIPFSFDIMTLATMFIGAFAVIFTGYWIYDQRWSWNGKNQYQRLWAILGYGTAVLYGILLVLNIQTAAEISMSLLIGLGANYLIIAFIVATASTRIKALRV